MILPFRHGELQGPVHGHITQTLIEREGVVVEPFKAERREPSSEIMPRHHLSTRRSLPDVDHDLTVHNADGKPLLTDPIIQTVHSAVNVVLPSVPWAGHNTILKLAFSERTASVSTDSIDDVNNVTRTKDRKDLSIGRHFARFPV
jgi:hypothetical protein